MSFGARGSSERSEATRDPDFPGIQKPFLSDIFAQGQQLAGEGVGSEGIGSQQGFSQAFDTAAPLLQRAAVDQFTLGNQIQTGQNRGLGAVFGAARDAEQIGLGLTDAQNQQRRAQTLSGVAAGGGFAQQQQQVGLATQSEQSGLGSGQALAGIGNRAGGIARGQLDAQRGLLGLGSEGSTQGLVDSLRSDIGQQLDEDILPGLRGQEVGVGALGGSRGELAAGRAAEGASRAFGAGSAAIRQSDLTRRQGALEGLASTQIQGLGLEANTRAAAGQISLQGLGQGAQVRQQVLETQLAGLNLTAAIGGQLTEQRLEGTRLQAGAASQALALQITGTDLQQEGADQLLNLGLAQQEAVWRPLQNYAAIIEGTPSIGVLGQSKSNAREFGFNIGLE